ncbi:MAG: sigma 54-interacting transcriptional regulator, partial [Planctomycetes bacterium]|nr:sigma 54-interacting transcriptional regulator [Planctomycetota bacterium]
MAILRILEGKGVVTEIEVDRPLVIGRGDDADVRIFDETCSRRHVVVKPDGEGFVLEDLGSSNGTFLNGRRAPRAALEDRDEILVGATKFAFLLSRLPEKGTVLLPREDALAVHSTIEEREFRVVEGRDREEDLRRLTKAYETGRSLSGILDPDAIVEKTLQILMDGLQPDRAALLRETGAGGVEVAASRGAERSRELVLSRAVAEQVARERKAVLIRDAETDPRFRDRESLIGQGVRTALCAPLADGDLLLGMLYADRTGSGEPFGKRDLEALLSIARQAAPALRNAEAFALERDRRKDVERSLGAGGRIVGESPVFRKALELVRRAGESDATVLLRGETGTGKEVLARLLHEAGTRRKGPFVAINCAALVGTLLESELFGHEKGAFTGATARKPGKFELAGGGTLFLDEIGEMAPEMQAKILRAIQEREFYRVGGTAPVSVDIRLVAATNRDLAAEVEAGRFRRDLYYRVGVVTIDVPPLRERREDVGPLLDHALAEACSRVKRKGLRFSKEARRALEEYRWPGNIRELMNVVERAVVLGGGSELGPDLLPPELTGAPAARAGGAVITLREAERRAILAALESTGWKKGETAEILGIS